MARSLPAFRGVSRRVFHDGPLSDGTASCAPGGCGFCDGGVPWCLRWTPEASSFFDLREGGETLAMSTPDAVQSAANTLQSTVTTDAGAVLPYAAGLAAIAVGWRVVRRFVKI